MKEFRSPFACLFILMAMLIFCTECRNPVLHRVGGGRYTWAPNMNFSEWTRHENFYLGDWLYFGFDRKLYSVLEVNKTSYDNCIDENFIVNITRGGRDVFQLTEVKTYYFLSGRGYCFMGMKVAVTVEDPPTSFPAPILVSNGCLSDKMISSRLLPLLFLIGFIGSP